MVQPAVIGLAFAAFLLGALPSGFIIGKLQGVDLRTVGSGNIGATNARRVLGKRSGILTLLFDAGKGALAASLDYLIPLAEGTASTLNPLYGICAIAGHCYSPFLKFKGGKGVATGLGVFLVISPAAAAVGLFVFACAYRLSGFASVGSISAAAALPIAMYFSVSRTYSLPEISAGCVAALVITINHRSNIRRLIRRQELAAKQASGDAGKNNRHES